MNKIIIFGLCWLSINASATPLTNQEKLDFIKGSIPSCIAKQSANRHKLSKAEENGIKLYCQCHASVMTSLVTREEMLSIQKSVLPSSFPPKVQEAQKQCIKSLTN